MKLYLKIFLISGATFGLVAAILVGFTTDLKRGIALGVGAGPLFGLWMALTIGTTHKVLTRKYANSEEVTPNQSTTIELDSSLDQSFEQCTEALAQFGAMIQSSDKMKLEIKAATGMSWKSYGEILTIRLIPGHQNVRIEISSSPKLKTTLVDYGKGRKNVDTIARLITTRNSQPEAT